jgi:hypothetical protein
MRAGVLFALSGAAFALGNLLLARSMSVSEFGQLALEISLLNLLLVMAPLGLDQALLRHKIDPGPQFLGLSVLNCTVLSAAAGAIAYRFYELPGIETVLVSIAIAAAGTGYVAAAGLRNHGREILAMVVITTTNVFLLMAGVSALFVSIRTALPTLTLVTAGNVLAAAAGWAVLMTRYRVPPALREGVPWGEALSLLGVVVIGALTIQLERLIIPKALSKDTLAIFSVLSSVAIFPFRIATLGTGFALVPRLRSARDLAARAGLIRQELRSIFLMLALASAAVLAAAPTVAGWVTAGRYDLGYMLVLAACVSGCVKVIQTIPRVVIIGCGTRRAVALLNGLGWLGIVASAAGGFVGSAWGLIGLMLGVALGGLLVSLPMVLLASRAVRNFTTSKS